MHFGTIAAGRIGLTILRRLKPFDMKLHYYDPHRLPAELEQELDLTFDETTQSLVRICDIVNLQTPLYPSTKAMFNEEMLSLK
jgi:formate dehydrogenase